MTKISKTKILLLASIFIGAHATEASSLTQNTKKKIDSTTEQSKKLASDTKIIATINEKYLADPDIKVLAISVECNDGKVALRGYVPSEAIKEKAISLARLVEGVKEVRSEIQVKP